MRFMLDTSTCIFLIRKKPPKLLDRVTRCAPGDLGLSAVTVAELEYGVAKSSQPARNQEALEGFLFPLEIAEYDRQAARAYGLLRVALERRGTPIGSLDMLIGAHALALGVILVTNNIREFKRIPALQVVDWTR